MSLYTLGTINIQGASFTYITPTLDRHFADKKCCCCMTMAANEIQVGLVGAGIGGLAAAIALRRAGVRVTVLEAAQQLGEVISHQSIMCCLS